MRNRRLAVAGAAIALATALVVAAVLTVSHGGSSTSATVSTDPGSFDLPRLDGKGEVRLLSFRGRPTVVNFFASWCTACESELPGFSKLSRELKAKVNFVGVNSLENGDGMAMARRFGIDWWPLARDVDGQQDSGLHDALGGQGMPITAFYDRNGKLLYVSPGALPEADLQAVLQHYYGIG
jgi:cytochrome c biogenesis protein CcmG/thiol:disulfide interchange protein DsbE